MAGRDRYRICTGGRIRRQTPRKNYLLVLAGPRGYTAAVLDIETEDLYPVPGTSLEQYSNACAAAAACMVFDDALKSVRHYDDHMKQIREIREARQALAEKREQETKDFQRLGAPKSIVKSWGVK